MKMIVLIFLKNGIQNSQQGESGRYIYSSKEKAVKINNNYVKITKSWTYTNPSQESSNKAIHSEKIIQSYAFNIINEKKVETMVLNDETIIVYN